MAAAVLSTLLETLVEETEERMMIAAPPTSPASARLPPDHPARAGGARGAGRAAALLGEAKDPRHDRADRARERPRGTRLHVRRSTRRLRFGGEAVAKLGVVGPTRMDYPGTMGAVRAVARYVGQILAES